MSGALLFLSGLPDDSPAWDAVWQRTGTVAYMKLDPNATMIDAANEALAAAARYVSLSCAQPNEDSRKPVQRADVLWWMSCDSTLPSAHEVAELLQPMSALKVPPRLFDPATCAGTDKWTQVKTGWADYPSRWAPLDRTDRVVITCTLSSLSAIRLWFLATTAPYELTSQPPIDHDEGPHSISSLLETDDFTLRQGTFTEYVSYLAAEHEHRISSMRADAISVDIANNPSSAPDRVREHAGALTTAKLAQANLAVTVVNLEAFRARLCERLDELGGPPPSSPTRWSFAISDSQQQAASVATVMGNADRIAIMQLHHESVLRHEDSEAERAATALQQAGTRQNTFATLLLAVAAAAFGGGALVSGDGRLAASILIGAGLLALGLFLIDFSEPSFSSWEVIVIVSSLAAAGGALASLNSSSWYAIAIGSMVGVLIGAIAFCVHRTLRPVQAH